MYGEIVKSCLPGIERQGKWESITLHPEVIGMYCMFPAFKDSIYPSFFPRGVGILSIRHHCVCTDVHHLTLFLYLTLAWKVSHMLSRLRVPHDLVRAEDCMD